MYENEGGIRPEQITRMTWDYMAGTKVSINRIAKEINGYFLENTEFPDRQKSFNEGDPVPDFTYLRDDGSTCSGNWLYCHSYTNSGNLAARRNKDQTDAQSKINIYPNWGWSWPLNRRILYNRASVDGNGKPFDERRPVIRWDKGANTGKGGWVGDVPDGDWPPLFTTDGGESHPSRYPYIMKKNGQANIFGYEFADGPFPEHYEPLETPVGENPLNHGTLHNPAVRLFHEEDSNINPVGSTGDFPIVATTFEIAEHSRTGVATRWQPWFVELQPQSFIEISEELAQRKEIQNGDNVIIESARGNVSAVAVVTVRFKPFQINGKTVHQVGLSSHFGWITPTDGGDSSNILTPDIVDPNAMVPETKAFLVRIRKADI